MSSESLYNSQLNQNGFNEGNILFNNRRLQQQQAQNLFRQRQLMSQQQQRQQQQQQQHRPAVVNALPPTPTLSSQGSPAFSQVAQVVPPSIKSVLTPSANKSVLPQQQPITNFPPRTAGMGQAVLRLLQFRDQLSPGDQAQDISFWNTFVEDFFTSNAMFKVTLWDNLQKKHTEFDIIQSLIARFFFTHYECDLESIQLTTDQTMEYFLPTGMMLECPRSSLIYRYKNGTLVILSGELSVLFNMDQNDGILKIHQWKFKCNHHDEYIARSKLVSTESNAALKKKTKGTPKIPSFHTPEVLVNSWGLPNRITELLNITDISNRFGEVVFFSQVTGLPPQDALTAMSFALSQQMPFSYPEIDGRQPPEQQSIKDELEDLMSSPLLTTDFLSLSSFPDANSNLFIQQQHNNVSSAAPTPTPIHNAIPSNNSSHINMTPQLHHNTIVQNNSNVMMNSPRQQHNHHTMNNGNHLNTPQQHHMAPHNTIGTPQQNHSIVDTSQQQNNFVMNTPQQMHNNVMNASHQVNNNIMGTPQQVNNSMMGTPQQANNSMMGTPQQLNNMMSTPQQVNNNLMGTPQQVNNNMMSTPQQVNNNLMGTPQQVNNNLMGTPQQSNSVIGAPLQQNNNNNNNLMGTPLQQNMTMINTPQQNNTIINTTQQQNSPLNNNNIAQPANSNLPANIQLMQQQAAMQRYYQQQRIQQQQHALQMQQRQALQRLQSPYTTANTQQPTEVNNNSNVIPNSTANMQSSAPPSLTIENVTPESAKTTTPRKRKMSTQKDGPKKAPGKKNKK